MQREETTSFHSIIPRPHLSFLAFARVELFDCFGLMECQTTRLPLTLHKSNLIIYAHANLFKKQKPNMAYNLIHGIFFSC